MSRVQSNGGLDSRLRGNDELGTAESFEIVSKLDFVQNVDKG